MNRDEWERALCEVRDEMAKYVWPSVTSISQTWEDRSRGAAWGTGNYVWLRDAPYLLTNAHVVEDAVGSHLAHLPGPTDDYVGCRNPFLVDSWPVEIALMRLGAEWSAANRTAIRADSLAPRYEPAQHELLFWLGFPGYKASRHDSPLDHNRRYTLFGSNLQSPGFPMLTQAVEEAVPNLPLYDVHFHVALHYPAKGIQHPGQAEHDLPHPKGMSGSLLWDTHFVADTRAGRKWNPNHARVCGLIFSAHPKPEIVVATKIEHLRPTLLAFLRHEAAYYNWINRGKPLWEDMVDWTWAENRIRDLS